MEQQIVIPELMIAFISQDTWHLKITLSKLQIILVKFDFKLHEISICPMVWKAQVGQGLLMNLGCTSELTWLDLIKGIIILYVLSFLSQGRDCYLVYDSR